MRTTLAAGAAGLVFGIGLTISQMIDPAKVIGFLDVAGNWDPTLVLVMAGALCVTVPGFVWARRRGKTLPGDAIEWPSRTDIDRPLVLGATLFGLGWGISGFCPGPAISALATGVWQVAVFGVAMIAGMVLYRMTPRF